MKLESSLTIERFQMLMFYSIKVELLWTRGGRFRLTREMLNNRIKKRATPGCTGDCAARKLLDEETTISGLGMVVKLFGVFH